MALSRSRQGNQSTVMMQQASNSADCDIRDLSDGSVHDVSFSTAEKALLVDENDERDTVAPHGSSVRHQIQAIPSHLQQIMFDPLSYIHPHRLRLPAEWSAPLCRAVVNDIVLLQYQLSTELPMVPQNSLAGLLLMHWYRLPQLAFLIGCQRLRAELAWGAEFAKLPDWAWRFASLTLGPQRSARPTQPITTARIDAEGWRIVQAWHPQLPTALQQRLPLLYSPTLAITGPTEQERVDKSNILLLTLAIQHAKNYPNPTPTLGA